MSEAIKPLVDTSSAQFKEGLDAGLNSAEDTKNWEAGNELGQELRNEAEKTEPVSEPSLTGSSGPLFVKDREGHMGNAQDEKDETEE